MEQRGAVNRSDMLLLTGPSDSPDFPTTVNAFRHRGGQPTQAFLAMLNPESGQLLFSTFLGTDAVEGYGIQRGNGVIAGLQDEAYFFGEATGGFPATLGTFRTPQSNDSTDPYVVKLRLSFPEERRKESAAFEH